MGMGWISLVCGGSCEVDDNEPITLQLRVIKTSIPVVLVYPFLTKHQPHIDLKRRFVMTWMKCRIYEIQALPATDSFRITASTTGVMEVEWDMLQAHSVATGNSSVKVA